MYVAILILKYQVIVSLCFYEPDREAMVGCLPHVVLESKDNVIASCTTCLG